MLDTMGLQAEDGCPNGTEELWVPVSVNSRVLEVVDNALPVYIGNIISF